MKPHFNSADLMLHPLVFREAFKISRLALQPTAWVDVFYATMGCRVNDFLRFFNDTANPGYFGRLCPVKVSVTPYEKYLPRVKHP